MGRIGSVASVPVSERPAVGVRRGPSGNRTQEGHVQRSIPDRRARTDRYEEGRSRRDGKGQGAEDARNRIWIRRGPTAHRDRDRLLRRARWQRYGARPRDRLIRADHPQTEVRKTAPAVRGGELGQLNGGVRPVFECKGK